MSDYPSKDNNNQRTEREREWMVGREGGREAVCGRAWCEPVSYTPIFMLSLVTTKPRVPELNFSFHILVPGYGILRVSTVGQS